MKKEMCRYPTDNSYYFLIYDDGTYIHYYDSVTHDKLWKLEGHKLLWKEQYDTGWNKWIKSDYSVEIVEGIERYVDDLLLESNDEERDT